MSKEFKALEIYLDKRIKDIKNYLEVNERSEDEEGFTPSEELQICYLAKRMLAIDNAKPSEALEILEDISKEECLFNRSSTVYMGGEKVDSFTWKHTIGEHFKGIEDIKQALIKAQENEKILSVIKEKHLFEPTHKYIVDYSKDYDTYCKLFESYKLDEANKLIENEFKLLKVYFEKKYVKIIARNVKRGS